MKKLTRCERFEVVVFYAPIEPHMSKLARVMLRDHIAPHDTPPPAPETTCGHKHRSLKAAIKCARSLATGMNAHGSPSARVEKISADGSRDVIHRERARGCRVTFC